MKKIIRKKKYGYERRTMLTHISQDAGAALAHFCRYGKKSGVVAFGEIERVHAKSHRNARISRAERPRLSRGRRRTALDALDGAREDGVGAIPGRHGRGGLGQHNKHDDNSGGPIARAGAAHYSRVFGPGGPRQGGCQHPSLMNSSESQTARSARVLVLRFPWYRQAHWPSALDVGDACPWSGDDLTPPSSETTEMKLRSAPHLQDHLKPAILMVLAGVFLFSIYASRCSSHLLVLALACALTVRHSRTGRLL